MSHMSNFLISKWYLDCTGDDGTVFIGYSAAAKWKMLSFHFSSVLLRYPDNRTYEKTSWTKGTLPECDGTTFYWSPRSLKVEASWENLLKPIERPLYKDDEGEIYWSCLAPKARAHVALEGFPAIAGLGYVECLKLSIVPWRLPMNELRWGRFLTDQDSLVWIDWTGRTQKTLVLHNCSESAPAHATDNEVAADGGLKLSLVQQAVVRSGPIVSSVVPNIRGLKWMLPFGISRMHECKWLSKGILVMPDSPARSGWSIHEVVRFK